MKLLAVFAPLALAATVPTKPTDWPASLEVEANGHASTAKLEITIQNKSPKAFNILKAGSILDEKRLETMFVRSKPPCGYQLVGILEADDVDPKDESEFQLMPAYGNITTTIDLIDIRREYRVCGNSSPPLSIDATFLAAEAGSTTLVHEVRYKMDPVLMSFEKLPPLPEAFEERVYKCSPEFLSLMKEGFRNCASQATAAREAALNGSAERMEAYFYNSSQETRNSIADTFAKVAEVCNVKDSRLYYTCDHAQCFGDTFGGVFRGSDPAHVYLCTRAFFLPMLPDLNEVTSLTHTIIHEMTHVGFVRKTKEYVYGLARATRFQDTSLAVENADNYALFSDAVYLKEDGLNQTRVDDIGKRFDAGFRYKLCKLENVTRAEFLSLTPAARIERFGFEF
ncbi:hypothetical protein MY10362_004710 [Beauveria mimosiformis]